MRFVHLTAAYIRHGLVFLTALLLTACPALSQIPASTPQESQSPSPPLANITATPNPVPAGLGAGTTKISWRTGDNTVGQVYMSENGGPERLFARGTDGSTEAPWIGNGSTYVFRLYSTGEPRRLLASVEVRGTDEVARDINLALVVSRIVNGRRIASFVVLVLLCSGAWYVARRGHHRLSRKLFYATAATATLLTLLSVLSVEPRPFQDQPFPDAHENADAARQLVKGRGFVTYIYDGEPRPLRSPPGFALSLTPFAAISDDYPSNIQTGTKIFAVLYVLAAVIAAWSMGGPLAAALTAILIGVSPFARTAASLVMSDALGAALTVLFILLVRRSSKLSVSVAGSLAGALIALRLPLLVNLVALLIVLPGMAWRLRAFLFASPPMALLGFYNWWTFGSPFKTGYSYWLPDLKSFSWSYAFVSPPQGDGPWIIADALKGLLMQWVCPCPVGGPQASISNIFFYPLVLSGIFWTFAPPLATLCGLFYLWRQRRDAVSQFTILVIGLSLLLFTFYFHQGTRFMAAPATLLVVFSALNLARWLESQTGLTDVMTSQERE